MITYTKEQLIAAQMKYNTQVLLHPDGFEGWDVTDTSEKKAIGQIEYLLELVEEV